MRKFKVVALVMVLCFMLTSVSFAGNSDTLAGWGIKVNLPDECVAILDGSDGCYYIYPDGDQSIPYVMIYQYTGYDDAYDLLQDYFIDMMKEKYPDMEIVEEVSEMEIGDKDCVGFSINYDVEGYEVYDTRIFVEGENNDIIMFASKEVPELNKSVGNLLYDTIETCSFIDDDIEIEIEDPDVIVLNWEDPDVTGDWVKFKEIGMELFVPDFIESVELTEDMQALGYIGYYTTDAEVEPDGFSVQYFETDEVKTMDEYVSLLESINGGEANDIDFLGTIILNGEEYLYYTVNDDIGVVGRPIKNGILEVAFTMVDDFEDIVDVMLTSLRSTKTVNSLDSIFGGISSTPNSIDEFNDVSDFDDDRIQGDFIDTIDTLIKG